MELRGKKLIALLAFLVNLNDTFDNCCVSERQAVLVLSFSQGDDSKKVYTAFNANELRTMERTFIIGLGWWSPTPSLNIS